MKVPCVIVVLFICFKGVVGENCGSLNYSQPAFKWRNVTIIYKPFSFSATEKPLIFYNDGKQWTPVPSAIMYNSTLSVFTTVLDTNLLKTWNPYVFARYRSCISQMILDLQVKPEIPVLNVPILREGSPANITCISRGGRPAANLSLWLDGKNASVDHLKTYNKSTRTYTTTITLKDPARKDWNGKYVSCLSSSPLFGVKETQRKTINCKYPPSTMAMIAPNIPRYLQDNYSFKFSCLTDTYNDFCWISWTKDGQLLYANGDETGRMHDSSEMAFVNVSKEINGQSITCNVICLNFDVQLSKSHVVQVPYQPSVRLSVKDEVLLNAHATTNVTCTANSLLANIVWSVYGDTQLIVCNKSQECEINIFPLDTNEHRNYTCTAYFESGNYSLSTSSSFVAVGRASTRCKDKAIEGIAVGLSVFIAVVIISMAIVFARKRILKVNHHENPIEPQPAQYANVQEYEN
ncbi:kin of IRRE-like protein 3 isoform X1 [Mya arenaria]|uniref:kin of IRRE-like protein 3 isoform X1 n=1 Tax=Mya arenaria TaxID=6604 RepID=UPI0022E84DE8|nr:kin of IRRE-like protein 3 isoform X1 [Mya arenaria]